MATAATKGADLPIRSQSMRTRRPPTTARPELPRAESSTRAESSRPHRRSSQRSASSHGPSDAPPPIKPAGNGAPEPDHQGDLSDRHRQQSKHKRTSITVDSGTYEFVKTLGQGSMGKVKLAKKVTTGEQVACKIIERISPDDGRLTKEERDNNDKAREVRNAREAAVVGLLFHPHICALYNSVRTRYHWYMLFEYINGGQVLDYIISHGKLKEKLARRFARQIASALDYCHRNNIVHRDLKIENILISKSNDIKIIDFGLSNTFKPRGDLLKTFCGSLYFAAPELLQARPYTGPEVDIWSFGVVIFVLVCGKVPFDDPYMPALHQKIKKGAVDYPNWLSTDCKNLISKMLTVDPKQRVTLNEVMNHPWMTKGFNGPPENHLPPREPLSLPLDPKVIADMGGFNFGTPETIHAALVKIIESERYQYGVQQLEREKEPPQPPKDVEKKRAFGFYRRRNSLSSRDTLTNPSAEGLPMGTDPLNAFHPLLSIYYLVREKQERDQKERERSEPQTPTAKPPPSPQEPAIGRAKEKESIPQIMPPKAAHLEVDNRTRHRARSHSEDQVRETTDNGLLSPNDFLSPQKKENAAVGLLRRLSTRGGDRRREASDSKAQGVQRTGVSMRAKSLGHARRESIQARRARREAEARDQQPVREETDAELGDGADGAGEDSGVSKDQLEQGQDPDLAKPVYLKGIFSVSTTSTKPLTAIRADIKRVLKMLAVEYTEIKGGFTCSHQPSIVEVRGSSQEPTVDGGEIQFEIVIVKVPIVSLHGVQFKRLGGNTWQYKALAEQIVKELRL